MLWTCSLFVPYLFGCYSTLYFIVVRHKKFSNGLEVKLDIKARDLFMCLCIAVIGVLGMVPTGCAVRGSRRLKGDAWQLRE